MLEVILIILGGLILTAGYLIPAGKDKKEAGALDEDQVRELVEREVDEARDQIGGIVEETISYAMEKTERSMERISNEKILAVGEYSDTVLGEIHKNHEEVVFLYDMLTDKHETLKATVSEANKTAEEVKQTLKDAEVTAKEVKETVESVRKEQEESAQKRAAFESAQGRQSGPTQAEPMQSPQTGTALTGAAMPYGTQISAPSTGTFTGQASTIGFPSGQDAQIGTPSEQAQTSDEVEFKPLEVSRVKIVSEEEVVARPGALDDSVLNREDLVGQQSEEETFVPVSGDEEGLAADFEKAVAKARKGKSKTTKKAGTSSKKAPAKQTRAKDAAKEPEDPTELPMDRQPILQRPDVEDTPDFTTAEGVEIEFHQSRGGRNNNERILALHKAGKSNMAIAKELGLGIGEVKLVIDLFKGTKK